MKTNEELKKEVEELKEDKLRLENSVKSLTLSLDDIRRTAQRAPFLSAEAWIDVPEIKRDLGD